PTTAGSTASTSTSSTTRFAASSAATAATTPNPSSSSTTTSPTSTGPRTPHTFTSAPRASPAADFLNPTRCSAVSSTNMKQPQDEIELIHPTGSAVRAHQRASSREATSTEGL